MRGRSWVVVSALLVLLAAAPPVAAQGPSGPSEREAQGSPPPAEDRSRGLVYKGLRVGAPDGPCRGLFEVQSRAADGGRPSCTHGPDPVRAPAGEPEGGGSASADLAAGTTTPPSAGFSCHGSGSDGYRVHVAYARASDRPDRFEQTAPLVAKWVAAIDAMLTNSAAQTGGSQEVRWLTDSSCRLVVDHIVLTPGGDDSIADTVDDLRDQGYSRSDRKYLLYADASAYCGIAELEPDDGASGIPGTNANNGDPTVPGLVARVDNTCWGIVDGPMLGAHELMHTLGGVQQSAPNATAGWHCTDDADRMCYDDDGSGPVKMRQVCPSTQEKRFDCNHDDYYSTNPRAGSYLATHWNTARSAFLTPVGSAPPPPPANDAFAGAESLAGAQGTRAGASSLGATKETAEPNHAGYVGGASVWFRWTAPASGTATIDTRGSDFDTALAVYTGATVNGLTPVASNDDDPNLFPASKVTFTARAGTTYSVVIDGLYGAAGSLRLNWVGPAPPEKAAVDFDGDGRTDTAVYRPSSGAWFVRGGTSVAWGTSGDIPVPADYDGDGDAEPAVFRPSSGLWFVHGGPLVAWGTTGDIPVPADYDGDGDAEPAVFRPASGLWFVQGGTTVAWGASGDVPVPADYGGDGLAEPAVFRPASGTWFPHGSAAVAWGTTDDIALPLPAAIRQAYF